MSKIKTTEQDIEQGTKADAPVRVRIRNITKIDQLVQDAESPMVTRTVVPNGTVLVLASQARKLVGQTFSLVSGDL